MENHGSFCVFVLNSLQYCKLQECVVHRGHRSFPKVSPHRKGGESTRKKKWQRGLKTVEERGEIFELILQNACPDPSWVMLCLTRKVLADLSWFCTTTAQAFAFLATQPSCRWITRAKKTKHHPCEVSMSSFWCSFKVAVSALHKDLGSCFLYHFQNLK